MNKGIAAVGRERFAIGNSTAVFLAGRWGWLSAAIVIAGAAGLPFALAITMCSNSRW